MRARIEYVDHHVGHTQRNMKAQTDPLQAFLREEDTGIKKGGKERPDACMDIAEFKACLRQWANDNGFKLPRWNSDFYNPVFDEHGLSLKKGLLYGIYKEGLPTHDDENSGEE